MASILLALAVLPAIAIAQLDTCLCTQTKRATETITETKYITQLVQSDTSLQVGSKQATSFTCSSSTPYTNPTPSSTGGLKENQDVYIEYQPSTSPVYIAPTTPIYDTFSATPSVALGESGSDYSSGATHSNSGVSRYGQITYFPLGLGSCGENNAGEDESINIVALSAAFLGDPNNYNGPIPSDPNKNPYCKRSITIKANGRTTNALIKDKCPECPYDNIDVSEKVFIDLFDNLTSGRLNCEWYLD